MNNPFFSVIIPTYNRRNFLKKAVDSVLAQTSRNFELIVVDDGSTDGTDQLIRTYQDSRILYLHQENKGVAAARNYGLAKAQAQWIAFLDSDDWWLPRKLETGKKFIQRNSKIEILHTQEKWLRAGIRAQQKAKHRNPCGYVYAKVIKVCCVSISTAIINKSVFDAIGAFDESFPACEDYDFWLRAAYQYEIHLIPEYLTVKEGGREDQLSAQWGLDKFRAQALRKILLSGKLDQAAYDLTFQELEKKVKIYAHGAEKRGRIEEAVSWREMLEVSG